MIFSKSTFEWPDLYDGEKASGMINNWAARRWPLKTGYKTRDLVGREGYIPKGSSETRFGDVLVYMTIVHVTG